MTEKVSNFPFAKTNFALKGVSHLSEYTKVEVKHELTGHFCECLKLTCADIIEIEVHSGSRRLTSSRPIHGSHRFIETLESHIVRHPLCFASFKRLLKERCTLQRAKTTSLKGIAREQGRPVERDAMLHLQRTTHLTSDVDHDIFESSIKASSLDITLPAP